MNALHVWQNWLIPAVTCSIVVISLGCNDVTSPSKPSGLQKLTSDAPVVESDATVVKTVPESAPTAPAAAPESVPSLVQPAAVPLKKSVAVPASPPDEIYEPSVVLSSAHELTSLVNVGDPFPNLALRTLSDEPVVMDEVRGDKLTVVVFWAMDLPFGRAQFNNLAREVALPFRHLGVKVVAVNVGDPVEQIEMDEQTKENVLSLMDPDGAAASKVAKSRFPRTYLLDAEGQILWFDLEYSRTTRRQLKNAIFFFARDAAAAAS